MNFFSTLCLVHPATKLSQLRGHYTEGNKLFARSGTKQLSDFHYQIQFNQIYFQQERVYFETVSQLLKSTNHKETTTILIFTSNQHYRFEILKQVLLHLRKKQKVFLTDHKLLKTGQIQSIDEMEDETKDLQQLTFQTLDILHSQIKHRRSLSSSKISLKVVGGDKEFSLNILQVNLSNSKQTQIIHKQFKSLFEEGIIDEQQYGPRSKELNQSNNIFLLTYLTFEEKKRVQQECYLEFLSRINYSSQVQKLKQNKKTQTMITQLTLLKQNKNKLNQQIHFYNTVRIELDQLIGEQLKVLRKYNINYQQVGEYKVSLEKGMKKKLEEIQVMKQKLKKHELKQSKESISSKSTTLLASMKNKLKNKLQLLTGDVFDRQNTQNIDYNHTESRIDLNQSTFSKSTSYTRPKSAMRTKYLDLSKTIITKQNSKKQQHSLIQSKKQEINTLPEIAQLYSLIKQMKQSSRNQFLLKYGL